MTPEEREARLAAGEELHANATPILPGPCDLLDIERRLVEVGEHRLLAIDLWFQPVSLDGTEHPVFYLGLLADIEAANTVHLLSPEQYEYLNNQPPASAND